VKKIGIIGSGFIVKGLLDLIVSKKEFSISNILTRTDINDRGDFVYKKFMTNSLDELIDNSDIIVECTGDVSYATKTISKIMQANIPIVTMNTEFNVTVGSYFVDKCFITEGEGDQPGSLAALNEEAEIMGFSPLVFGNIKGFLNNNPTREDMEYWAKKSNLSLSMVTSFTDGTKVQMEQAFVANGLGATILKQGLSGTEDTDIKKSAIALAEQAKKIKSPISDYVLSSKGPAGVFITATHDENQKDALRYYKMGEGPFYTLVKEYHLPHLELYKTIVRVLNGGDVLLNNGKNPSISVASIAKKDLKAGNRIDKAIGSFDIRGEAVKIDENLKHIPIGLLNNAVFKRDILKDEIVQFDDIEIEDNQAIDIWYKILQNRMIK